MDRKPRNSTWTKFLTGVSIGFVFVTPALALPPDLPLAVNGDIQFYALVGFGLLLVVALVMRTMRTPAAGGVVDQPIHSSTRFFPADRPIALE